MRCGAGSPRTPGSLAWPPTGLKRNGPSRHTRGIARGTTSRAASDDAPGATVTGQLTKIADPWQMRSKPPLERDSVSMGVKPMWAAALDRISISAPAPSSPRASVSAAIASRIEDDRLEVSCGTPRRKRTRSLTIDVPVPHHGRQARALEGAPEQLHERHRAMAAPGAAEGHGEVCLALPLVEGEKESQEVLDLGEQRPALLEGHHELLHSRVAPIQALEAVHEVRVGQEANVEDEVGVVGRAVLEAEGHQRHGEGIRGALGAVAFDEALLELVDGQSRGVDDAVRALAQVGERATLGPDALQHAALPRQGMTPPRLLVAPHQRLVGRLEEEHLGLVPLGAQLGQRLQEMREIAALADVDAEGNHADVAARVHAELGEGRDQGGGKVVDAEVAEVLEALDGEAPPRPRHAGNDHEAKGGSAAGRLRAERAHRFLGASRR